MSEMLSLHQPRVAWPLCKMKTKESELSFSLTEQDGETETRFPDFSLLLRVFLVFFSYFISSPGSAEGQ